MQRQEGISKDSCGRLRVTGSHPKMASAARASAAVSLLQSPGGLAWSQALPCCLALWLSVSWFCILLHWLFSQTDVLYVWGGPSQIPVKLGPIRRRVIFQRVSLKGPSTEPCWLRSAWLHGSCPWGCVCVCLCVCACVCSRKAPPPLDSQVIIPRRESALWVDRGSNRGPRNRLILAFLFWQCLTENLCITWVLILSFIFNVMSSLECSLQEGDQGCTSIFGVCSLCYCGQTFHYSEP